MGLDILIEKATEKEIVKALNIFTLCMLLVDILALFEFLLPYSFMQQHPKFRSWMRFLAGKSLKNLKTYQKCKTCLGQNFEHIIYIHICDHSFYIWKLK